MKKAFWAMMLFASLSATAVSAQTTLTATFTFGPVGDSYNNACAGNTSWNGSSTQYAEELGAICWGAGDPDSGPAPESFISIPFQLGFANNGYWQAGSPVSWGPIVCVQPVAGCATTDGGTYTQVGTSGNFYDAPGSSMTFTANFSVRKVDRYVRGRHYISYPTTITGGSGTVREMF